MGALLIAVVLVLSASPSPAIAAPTSQATPDTPQLPGFQSSQADGYVLYAPTQALLDSSRGPLDLAVEQFRRYFGQAPPTIAVIVFESPDQARSSDLGPLHSRGLAVLPWVAPQFLETQPFPNLGIIVRQTASNGGVSVIGTLSIEPPTGLQLQQGDSLVRLNGEPIQSIDDLQSRYDRIDVGSSVEVTIRRSGDEQVQTFTKPPSRYRIAEGGGGPDPSSILSHEAGHVFFISYVERQRGGQSRAGTGPSYGHPAIPDWFDEAIALLLEPQEMQAQRLAVLKRQLQGGASLVPLEELFQMPHPRAPSQTEGEGASGPMGAEEVVPGIGLSVGGSADATTEDGTLTDVYAIYYQTSALVQFLREREGPAFIGRVGDGLIRGESMSAIMAEARTVPSDLAALRQALHEWALSR